MKLTLPQLTANQRRILAIIAETPDAVLFDLEVQELQALGLIQEVDERLGLTELGRQLSEASGEEGE